MTLKLNGDTDEAEDDEVFESALLDEKGEDLRVVDDSFIL